MSTKAEVVRSKPPNPNKKGRDNHEAPVRASDLGLETTLSPVYDKHRRGQIAFHAWDSSPPGGAHRGGRKMGTGMGPCEMKKREKE